MIAGIPIAKVMQISPVFDILLGCSAIATGVALERFWTFHFMWLNPMTFIEKIRPLMVNARYKEVINICAEEKKPISDMVQAGVTNIAKGTKNVAKLMEAVRMSERMELERFLGILGTLGNSAPFIGLLGTVIGIIRAFKMLEMAESMGPTAIMVGIAEALVTTALGLLVAVPCVIAFNLFQERIKIISIQMEMASKELMVMIKEKSK
ncbi:MAG: MotA/TolQ/ExbB proton channel family protein [Candidatus Stahlbacteria bacterium]|nr:MotA/TolQ/ExbB proton channel family protein [Candidatus Stahlbacteria bacterium]